MTLASGRRSDVIVIEQDTVRRSVQVIELAAFQRPKEGGEANEAEAKGDRNQVDEDIHEAEPRLSRSAFSMTSSDDDDIAIAATSGVT